MSQLPTLQNKLEQLETIIADAPLLACRKKECQETISSLLESEGMDSVVDTLQKSPEELYGQGEYYRATNETTQKAIDCLQDLYLGVVTVVERLTEQLEQLPDELYAIEMGPSMRGEQLPADASREPRTVTDVGEIWEETRETRKRWEDLLNIRFNPQSNGGETPRFKNSLTRHQVLESYEVKFTPLREYIDQATSGLEQISQRGKQLATELSEEGTSLVRFVYGKEVNQLTDRYREIRKIVSTVNQSDTLKSFKRHGLHEGSNAIDLVEKLPHYQHKKAARKQFSLEGFSSSGWKPPLWVDYPEIKGNKVDINDLVVQHTKAYNYLEKVRNPQELAKNSRQVKAYFAEHVKAVLEV